MSFITDDFRDPLVVIFGFVLDPLPLRSTCRLTLHTFNYAVYLEKPLNIGVITMCQDDALTTPVIDQSVQWSPFRCRDTDALGCDVIPPPGSAVFRLCGACALNTIPSGFLSQFDQHPSQQNDGLRHVSFVDIPNVEEIGDDLLSECTSLESLHLIRMPSLRRIGNWICFRTSLRRIHLSHLPSLNKIGDSFLAHCQLLESLELKELPKLETIGQSFLSGCDAVSTVELIDLPELRSIGQDSFKNCGMKQLMFENLTGLENLQNTPNKCPKLEEVNLRGLSRLKTLTGAFQECPKLQTLVLDDLEMLRTIAANAFRGSAIKELKLEGSLPDLEQIQSHFANASSVEEVALVQLPRLIQIGQSFCQSCTHLKKVVLQDLAMLHTIETHFLNACAAVEEVVLEELPELSTIGPGFLISCTSLQSVRLEDLPRLTTIGQNFLNSSAVKKDVTLKNLPRLHTIQSHFLYSASIGSIELSNLPELDDLQTYAFGQIRGTVKQIDLVDLPRLRNIGNAFCYALQLQTLKTITLRNLPRLETIGQNSFTNCRCEDIVIDEVPRLCADPEDANVQNIMLTTAGLVKGSWIESVMRYEKDDGTAADTTAIHVDQSNYLRGIRVGRESEEDGVVIINKKTPSVGNIHPQFATQQSCGSTTTLTTLQTNNHVVWPSTIVHLVLEDLPELTSAYFYFQQQTVLGNQSAVGLPSLRSLCLRRLPKLSHLNLQWTNLQQLQQQRVANVKPCKLEEIYLEDLSLGRNSRIQISFATSLKRMVFRRVTFPAQYQNLYLNINQGLCPLEELTMDDCMHCDALGGTLAQLNNSNVSLRRVNLRKLVGLQVTNSALYNCSSLSVVVLHDLPDLNRIDNNFLSNSAITTFVFSDLPELSVIYGGALLNCRRLRRLGFKNLPKLSSITNNFANGCPNIRSVAFENVPWVVNDFLEKKGPRNRSNILNQSKNIRSFYLDKKCGEIDISAAEAGLNNWKRRMGIPIMHEDEAFDRTLIFLDSTAPWMRNQQENSSSSSSFPLSSGAAAAVPSKGGVEIEPLFEKEASADRKAALREARVVPADSGCNCTVM